MYSGCRFEASSDNSPKIDIGNYPETGFEEIGPQGTVTRFSFGHERVGGGGNSLVSTDVLGQSNGQELHTYRNRFGKTCLCSSGRGPHPADWATRLKPSRLPSILRQHRACSTVTNGASVENDTFRVPRLAGGSLSICNWWARQRSLLKIVVICPTTSASIPFFNCRAASRPAGYVRTTRLP